MPRLACVGARMRTVEMAIPMHGSRGLIWIHVPSLHSGILEPSQSKQIFHRPWIYRAADYTVPSQFLHKCRWYGRSQRKRGNPSPAELEQAPELQLLTPVLRPHCFHCWLLCYPRTHSTVDHHCHRPQRRSTLLSPLGCSFSVLSAFSPEVTGPLGWWLQPLIGLNS